MLVVVLGVWWGESSLDLFWGKQKEMSTWNSPQHADERGLPEWLAVPLIIRKPSKALPFESR